MKKHVFFLLMAIVMAINSLAQVNDTSIIGYSTGATFESPIYLNANNSYSQTIYTINEINNVTILMGCISDSTCTHGWIPHSQMQEVYSGEVDFHYDYNNLDWSMIK